MKEKILLQQQQYEQKFKKNVERMKVLSTEFETLKAENEQLRGAYAALTAALNNETETINEGENNGTEESQ